MVALWLITNYIAVSTASMAAENEDEIENENGLRPVSRKLFITKIERKSNKESTE